MTFFVEPSAISLSSTVPSAENGQTYVTLEPVSQRNGPIRYKTCKIRINCTCFKKTLYITHLLADLRYWFKFVSFLSQLIDGSAGCNESHVIGS